MKNKKFFLLFFVVFFFPFIAHAQSVSGSGYFYNQYWNIPQGHAYTSGYESSISCATQFGNTTYCFLPGGSQSTTGFIRRIYLNPQFNFVANKSYKIVATFNRGSYLLDSYTLYSFQQNVSLSFCGSDGNNNQLSTCSMGSFVSSNPSSNTYLSVATIYFTPTTSSSSAYFQIGSLDINNRGVLINTYSSQQGIRIDSVDITEVQSGSGNDDIIINNNQNTQNIINNQNQNTQNIINNQNNNTQIINDSLEDINNNLTDDDTSGATAQADSEISDFDIDDHGLGDIFNTIVTFIGNIANQTCSPLSFQLPFVHNQVTLPCMSTIYNANFPTFLALYQMITTGLIAYRVIINLFQKVKQLSDPNYDKVEVIQL